MKKFDTHVHSAPISCCGRLSPEQLVKKYADCKFDGFVLTNHYSHSFIENHGVSPEEWKELFVKNYEQVKKCGKEEGLEVFFGAEVSVFAPYSQKMRSLYSPEFLAANYADLLLFGITPEYFLKAPMLCELSLEELKAECNANGIYVVQAHPFRTEQHHSPRPPKLLDGVEINGCVGFATSCEKEVLEMAKNNGLFVTAGGDTHYDWHKLATATFIPENVHDSVALANYLHEVKVPEYSLKEQDDFAPPRPV